MSNFSRQSQKFVSWHLHFSVAHAPSHWSFVCIWEVQNVYISATCDLCSICRKIIFDNNMIPRRFMLFIAAAFVLQFQMYAQLMMLLIILSLADIQLERRAFLRLCKIRRRRQNSGIPIRVLFIKVIEERTRRVAKGKAVCQAVWIPFFAKPKNLWKLKGHVLVQHKNWNFMLLLIIFGVLIKTLLRRLHKHHLSHFELFDPISSATYIVVN